MTSLYCYVGILGPVSNLTTDETCDSIIDIHWTAPYSIDVPSTDPDIIYTVWMFSTQLPHHKH